MEKKGRHELCLYMEQFGTIPYFTTDRYDELDGYYYNPRTGDIIAFELKKRASHVNDYLDYIYRVQEVDGSGRVSFPRTDTSIVH